MKDKSMEIVSTLLKVIKSSKFAPARKGSLLNISLVTGRAAHPHPKPNM
jgi:hypothetical protein